MGTVFDVYNTVTGATKWFRWLRPILDILFWVVSSCAVYYAALSMDNGRLRFYTFGLLAIGYVVYRVTIRDAVVGSAFRIVRFFQAVFRFITRVLDIVLWRPLMGLLHGVFRILRVVYTGLCRVEDALFWILRLVFVRMIWPWLCRFPGVQHSFRWAAKEWEEFLGKASNWLKSKLARL